jgi:hypothetical protein
MQENQPHYVYLLHGVGTTSFKIGMSVDSDRRARQLSLPFETEVLCKFMLPNRDEARLVEKGLHRLYRDRKILREWFRDVDEKFFVADAEWIAMRRFDRAERGYLERTGVVRTLPGRPKKKSPAEKAPRIPAERCDEIVLETLREEGIEAALALRKELKAHA